MRRIGRWMLNALTVLSLLLCVGTCVLWVGSYWRDRTLLTFHFGGEHRRLIVSEGWVKIDNTPQIADTARAMVALRSGILALYEQRGGKVIYSNGARNPTPPLPEDTGALAQAFYDDGASIPMWLPDRRDPSSAQYTALVSKWMAMAWATSLRVARVPLPIALLVFSGLPIARRISRRRRVSRRRQRGYLCPSCRYDLFGNVSGVCPECGTKIAEAK